MAEQDPLDLRGQEALNEDRAEREKRNEQTEVSDLQWQMGDKRGRRIVYRALERAGVWRLSFNTNALSMAFAEGMRNEGLRLMMMLNRHCPAKYSEMLMENSK